MSFFSVGAISSYLNKKIVIILFVQFIVLISFLGYLSWQDSNKECVACHSNKKKLKSLGYPQFYVTQEMAGKESNHANVKCHECHLGNGRAKDPDKAHKGILKVLLIGKSGEILDRKKAYPHSLFPEGKDNPKKLLPETDVDIRNILWHDRDPETLGFNPKIAEKTCGKSGCHPDEFKQFKKTIMAANFRQRTMRTWLEPYGPHNCGPSFADILPQEELKETRFVFHNTDDIARNLNISFTKDQAKAKQRFCNVCHAGCLDCHYAPDKDKGIHAFTKKPVSETCMGNGRGTSICHSGSMEMRRGETYIGGNYSEPQGMQSDVHYKKNIQCIDCHQTGEKGMGDMKRKAGCQDCHIEIEEAHENSLHKNLDCAACHINELRGYQITVWGPGFIAGKPSPFKKYSSYYGIQRPPILIKDQKGIWMPVKVWPHSVGNIKEEVKPSGKMMFRWPKGETRDAYYIIGTFNTDTNRGNRHLLWLEIEQAAHPYGEARKCSSCHKKEQQESTSLWEFYDYQGSESFKGTYRILADRKGLRIENIKNITPIQLIKGYNSEDFASWIFFKDLWKASGNFSIKTDREKYKRALNLFNELREKLDDLEKLSKGFDKKELKRYKRIKGVALHDYDYRFEGQK
ncbi:MAG: hypothetical protein HY755_05530 [Nitrospirae bacterium]|nr:hypothetical protein [Nitrospirota bacterium]